MPQALTLDQLERLTPAPAMPAAAPARPPARQLATKPPAAPGPAAAPKHSYSLDALEAMSAPAPAAPKPAPAGPPDPSIWRRLVEPSDDPEHSNFFGSFYDGLIQPIVGDIYGSFMRGDVGEKTVSDYIDTLAQHGYKFATHPAVLNVPLLGPGVTAIGDKMQRQVNEGNYQGAAGTLSSFIGMFLAPEAYARMLERLPAAVRTAAETGAATGRYADAASAAVKAGVKTAAPDVLKGTVKAGASVAAAHTIPGGMAGTVAEVLGATKGVQQVQRGIYQGAKAGRAAYAATRAEQAADAAAAEARAPYAGPPTEPLWKNARDANAARDAAEAARAADEAAATEAAQREAQRPPTAPLFGPGAEQAAQRAADRAAAADAARQAEEAARAEARRPPVLYHGAPEQLDAIPPGAAMSAAPDELTGAVHSARPTIENPAPDAGTLHGAEQKLIELAKKTGRPYNGLKGAAQVVSEAYGYDGILVKNAEGKITGAIPFTETPVEAMHEPGAPAPAAAAEATAAPAEAPAATGAAAAREPWQIPQSELIPYKDTVPKRTAPGVSEPGDYSEAALHENTMRARNTEDTPPELPPAHPIGTWGTDSTGELMQLRRYPIDDPRLIYAEGIPSEKSATVQKYADWIKEGSPPPPQRGLETENGNIRVQDGHHRTGAIKATGGKDVDVWVSVTHNRPIGQGQVMPEGVTHAAAIRRALDAGETVPAAVLNDYPELMAKANPAQVSAEAAAPAAEAAAAAPEAPAAAREPAPERTPEQKLSDWIDMQAAHKRMDAQDLEWGNRARQADQYARWFIKNDLAPTAENLQRAANELEPRAISKRTGLPLGPSEVPDVDTAQMIGERVDWHNKRTAAAAEAAAPEAAAAAEAMTPEEAAAIQHEANARALPRAKATVDGLEVIHNDIPNEDSIRASMENPEELRGVREVPFSLFGGAREPGDAHFSYDARENARTLKLAEQIRDNGYIKPLIVAFDHEGPYIVEGGHRFDALGYLGKKSFPAKVVLDTDALETAASAPAAPAAVNPLTAPAADVGRANAAEMGRAPTSAAAADTELEALMRRSAEAINLKRGKQQPAAIGHVESALSGPGPGNELPMDTGTTGRRPAVSSPATAGAGVSGERTAVDIPGERRAYDAKYTVKELDDLQPSHSGQTFNPNPRYDYTNDRDYTDPRNQRKIVDWSSPREFNPRNMLNTANTAELGPPIIDPRGNVIGGNGRTMILDRVYNSTEGGAAYRAELDRTAHHYGIDPADYAHMKQPVLVRELSPAALADEGAAARAITDFNKEGTASLTSAERAITDARGVSTRSLDDIARRMDKIGPDATLAQAIEGKEGMEVLKNLERDGVITPQETAKLAGDGKLTREGKNRISDLMLGRFFDSPRQMDTLPDAMRGKLERIAAPLARIEGNAEYSLSFQMRRALDLIENAGAHDLDAGPARLDDFINQGQFFSKHNYPPDVVQLAKNLMTRDPNALTAAVREYAAAAKYAEDYTGPGMFNEYPAPKKPGPAFNESFGPERLAAEAAAKAQKRAAKLAKDAEAAAAAKAAAAGAAK